MAGKYRLRGVYGKPLTKGTPLDDTPDRTSLLEETGEEAINAIKAEIRRLTFKGSADRLLESFSYRIEGESTLVIESDHPAAKYLDKGVRRYQMTHLTKASRPIPIIKDNGEVIFRNASPKSMQEGKWVHPGIRGKNFLDRGVDQARKIIKKKISDDIKQRLTNRIKGL